MKKHQVWHAVLELCFQHVILTESMQLQPNALPHKFNQHSGRTYYDDVPLNTYAAPVPEALKGRWGQAPRQQQPPASSQPPAYSRATAESSSKHNESDSSDVAENPLIEGIDRDMLEAQREIEKMYAHDQLDAADDNSDSSDVAENPLIEGIDKDMLEAQHEIEKMYVDPAESIGSDDSFQIPFDPNLVCPKCGRQFRRGQIQKFRKHHDGCQQ